jgi:hypothetical protein
MFGHPERVEAALLQRPRQFGRRHRVVGEKHGPPIRIVLSLVSLLADQLAGDGFLCRYLSLIFESFGQRVSARGSTCSMSKRVWSELRRHRRRVAAK